LNSRLVFLGLSFLASALEGQGQSPAETVTVVSSRGRDSLPIHHFAGVPMVGLQDLAALVGGSTREEAGSSTATFTIEDRTATLSSGGLLVPVGKKLHLLSAPSTVQGGRFWVPLDFLSKVLPELSPRKISYQSDRRTLLVGEAFPTLSVRTFAYAGYTRVVLEPSSKMPYRVTQEEGRIQVLLQSPYVECDFSQEELRDGVVERLAFRREREGYALNVALGERFASVKAFELEAPHRLVIDLMRRPESWASDAGVVAGPGSGRSAAGPKAGAGTGDVAPRLTTAPPAPGLRTITLDAGHGGAETGAKGPTGVLEKDITLAVARRLRALLENRLGVRVILTRDGDQDLRPDERTAIANQNKSDLFVSIHVNASPWSAARGAETYFLTYDETDDEAARVALSENASFSPLPRRSGDPLEFILWDMAQASFLNESATLAEILQEELNGHGEAANRGIKQAPFRVLMGATMPAVLVELGFITNPDEEKLLGSGEHQGDLAQSIFRGILRYKERYERQLGGSSYQR
jgi:N-acetylmuramoyl-L-alanine amidase